jgi:hypothetical protein
LRKGRTSNEARIEYRSWAPYFREREETRSGQSGGNVTLRLVIYAKY